MMKSPRIRAALASACVFCFTSASQAAFQDPLDTPAAKSALAPGALSNGLALAGKRIVSVGQRGHILYSEDAGKSWTQATVPVSSDLTAVFFASPNRGWAVGHGGVVLATQDGGTSWAKQLDGRAVGQLLVGHYADHNGAGLSAEALAQLRADAKRFLDEGPDKPFLDVWFENETTGYVVGLFNLILKTTDGGKSWLPWMDRTDNSKAFHFYAIRPVGNDLYLVGEQGMLLKLDPAAQRFKALPMDYKGTFFGITGKPGSVVVYGLRGSVFRSGDGGKSWQKIETGVSAGLTASTVTADGRILLVSQGGQVLMSSDDGRSFSRLKLERQVPASALLEVAERTLAISGARGIHVQPQK
jgi:photosystem II stability/assembly factor-like uncharacterized protein